MVPIGVDPEGAQFQFSAVIPTQASAPISSILFEFNVDSSPSAFRNCQDRKGICFYAQIEQEMLLQFSHNQTISMDVETKHELLKLMKTWERTSIHSILLQEEEKHMSQRELQTIFIVKFEY